MTTEQREKERDSNIYTRPQQKNFVGIEEHYTGVSRIKSNGCMFYIRTKEIDTERVSVRRSSGVRYYEDLRDSTGVDSANVKFFNRVSTVVIHL